ncbi:MAG: glycosyltransferase family 4 protein [Lachnospiraceae bacterium]|nr:glycosyltransferase family 4 protein [Lachnospiraceae bacterium]
MVRVLLLTHYDNMYGANKALLKLVLKMHASGRYEPTVVIPAKGSFTDILDKEGISYFVCPITQWQAVYAEALSFEIKKNKRKKAISNELEVLYEHFKDNAPDIIHSNSSVIGTGAMLAERFGCRHIWHVREFAREHYGMRYFYPEAVVKDYYEKADRVIAISEAVSRSVEDKYPGARTTVVYDGIETDLTNADILNGYGSDDGAVSSDSDDAAPDNSKITEFLYTGYIFPAKHQLDLLKAVAILIKDGCYTFHITLAGNGDERYCRTLENYIKKNKLDRFVTMMGFTDKVPELIKKSDVGVIASEYEGFGLVTAEYMLGGLPVLGRRSGATPEIILDGVTGFLFDDVNGLASLMRKFVDDPEFGKTMGEKGRSRVKECFTAEKNADDVMAVYDEVMKEQQS